MPTNATYISLQLQQRLLQVLFVQLTDSERTY
jgi:hypothetical protein